MKLLWAALPLIALLLVATEPLLVLVGSFFLLHLCLLSGFLVITPPAQRTPRFKVFCIGLSRTGTTSITVALNKLGYAAHHQCHALIEHTASGEPRVSKYWADMLDAHSDIAPATVFEELKELYPDARFVLTRREPKAWGRAMVRFCSKFRLILTCPPVSTMFSDIYGSGWPRYTDEQWANVYEAHERKVSAAFASAPERLLKLDIVKGDGWEKLCDFLGDDAPPPTTPFPHADVFALSAFTQVGWQLSRLRERFGKMLIACLVLVLALRPAVADHGQCTRACRVANARVGAPDVLGHTGHWFAEGVGGRRLLFAPSMCECYHVGSAGATEALPHPTVPRLHPAIETADQWHFNTRRVCAADGLEYPSANAARAAGADVSNCGQCSKCSSLESVDAMHRHATSLTKRASIAGVIYLLGGETVHWLLMRSGLIGFDQPCADCWLAATQCNLASCAQHCLYGWTNPLSASSTVNGSTALNACMQCDEIHCSAYFLQACGANRRTAGVVSDINRPSVHVCAAARADALERAASNATGGGSAEWGSLRLGIAGLVAVQAAATRYATLVAAVAALLVLLRVLLGPRMRPLPAGHYEQPRRFLLTGCASGMGRRLTATLLRAGHSVLATDVNGGALMEACNADGWHQLSRVSGGLMLRALDVRKPEAWLEVLEAASGAWEGLDTIINFAGLLVPASALDVTTGQIDAHIDVMVKGVMHGTVGGAKAFCAQARPAHGGHGGHIVNVSSLGAVAPVSGVSLYQAAKAGCRTFSIAAAKDLASKGVVVSVLMPDAVATPMAELQLLHDESAMAYSGGILTLDQLMDSLVSHVLPNRPMEKRLGATYVRQWGACFADCFPSSLAIAWTEAGMRRSGRAAQANECARRLAAGNLTTEESAVLSARLKQLDPTRSTATAPSGARQWLVRLRNAMLIIITWLAILHVGACAGPSDLAKASFGLPSHPMAAEFAVSHKRSFHGRVALVTGATSGVGLETAGALAEAGFHVLMGARSPTAATVAIATVRARALKRGRGGSAEVLPLDLADLTSVARAAKSISGRALHVLVCSAGVMPSPLGGEFTLTPDGIESVWGVNHLGHFALATALRPALRRAVAGGFPARLILVTSEHGHRYFGAAGLPAVLPPPSEGWNAFTAYGISKLSNVLHAREAARRWAADGIAAFAVHPGIVPTALGQLRGPSSEASLAASLHNSGVWLWWHVVARPVAESVESGAASVVFAALSESLDAVPFAYIKHCRQAEPAPAALNASASAFLWRESERLLASRPTKKSPAAPLPPPPPTPEGGNGNGGKNRQVRFGRQ